MKNNEFLERARVRKKRKIIIIVSVVIAIMFMPILTLMIMKQYTDNQLQNMLNDIRKNGYPTNFEEMAVWYKNGNKFLKEGEKAINVPDSENAAVLLNQGFKLFVDNVPNPSFKKPPQKESGNKYEDYYNSQNNSKGEFIDDEYLISVGFLKDKLFLFTPLPENIVKLNKIYLDANRPALKKIEEAIKKPYCKFDIVSKKTSYIPKLYKVRHGAKLFSLKAKLAIEDNNIDKSISEIKSAKELSNVLRNQPYLNTCYYRTVCESIVIEDLLYLLNKKQLSRSQLIELSKIVSEEPNGDYLQFALKTERVFVFDKEHDLYIATIVVNGLSFGAIKNGVIINSSFTLWLAEFSGLMAQNRLLYLKYTERYIQISKSEYFEVKDDLTEIRNERYALPDVYGFLKYYLCYEEVFKSRSLIIAEYRLARSAIAIELYKLKYHKLPEALSDLVPEFLDSVPIDPFDGKPLRYKICEVVKKQAVKMSKEERAKYIAKKKKRSSYGFGEMFGGQSEKYNFNNPLNGYKIIEQKRSGYMIYSVGKDCKDDGGMPNKSGSNSDLTWAVLR